MTTVLRNNAIGVLPDLIADPGDGGAISVSEAWGVCNIVTAGAETRTLANPKFEGQVYQLNLKTDGGACTITVTNGWNQIGNTAIVLNDAGDSITLIGIRSGANLRWRVVYMDGVVAEEEITDPGDAGAIPVTESGVVNLVSAGAETRTLANPTFVGQRLLINLQTDGGDVTLTVTDGWNQIGNTAIVFNDAGDSVSLIAAQSGANLRWRIDHIDGPIAKPEITDPGDAGAIPVTADGFVNLVTAGAETRTLADPTYEGQSMQLNFQTDGGDCVVTAATGVNQTGNNTLTFADAGDHLLLQGARSGANLVWRIVANDGVGLTTV